MTMFECAWSYGYEGTIRGRDFRATEHNNRNIFTSSSASLLHLFRPNEAPIPVGRGPVFASMDKRVSRPAPWGIRVFHSSIPVWLCETREHVITPPLPHLQIATPRQYAVLIDAVSALGRRKLSGKTRRGWHHACGPCSLGGRRRPHCAGNCIMAADATVSLDPGLPYPDGRMD